MNEFIIQIDNILKNIPMTRHNTAADKELPEDLPQELWAADLVWVRRGGHVPPLAPLYDGPYTVLQRSLRHFRLQMGDREDNVSTSRLKPCAAGAAIPTAAPPRCSRPHREQPPPAAPPKRVRFNLAPTSPPAAADPGTVFPGKPARFFARPCQGKHLEAATRNATAGRPPGNGTTHSSPLAATKKLGGALWAGTLRQGCLHPSPHHEYGA